MPWENVTSATQVHHRKCCYLRVITHPSRDSYDGDTFRDSKAAALSIKSNEIYEAQMCGVPLDSLVSNTQTEPAKTLDLECDRCVYGLKSTPAVVFFQLFVENSQLCGNVSDGSTKNVNLADFEYQEILILCKLNRCTSYSLTYLLDNR